LNIYGAVKIDLHCVNEIKVIKSSTIIKQLKLSKKVWTMKIIRKIVLKLSKKTRARKIIRKIKLQLIVPVFNKENTLK
jgi:hypothetical protein